MLQPSEYGQCIRLNSNIEKSKRENELFTLTMLQQIKEYVDEKLPSKTPGTEVQFDIKFNFIDKFEDYLCQWWIGYVAGTYGYNRYGKPKCKLRWWGVNPGGRFYFGAFREIWFTKIQNLIKYYVENGTTEVRNLEA